MDKRMGTQSMMMINQCELKELRVHVVPGVADVTGANALAGGFQCYLAASATFYVLAVKTAVA